MAESIGMVQVMTAQEVVDQQLEELERQNTERIAIISSLSQYVDQKWDDAKRAKEEIEDAMIESIHQRNGEYDAKKLAEILGAEQPDIYMNITATKCRNATAWIRDIIFQNNGRIFGVEPTPVPELPEQITQQIQSTVINQYVQMAVADAQDTGEILPTSMLKELIISHAKEIQDIVYKQAQETAKELSLKIEDKIDDDWIQNGFYKALNDVIDDIVTLKAGILKGPIFRKEKIKITGMDAKGKIKRVVKEVIVPCYERRSPFCIYPSPRSIGIDTGYVFDIISIRPRQLYELIGVEGYNEKEIRDVLKEFHNKELNNRWLDLSGSAKEGMGDDTREHDNDEYPEENIYCLELWDEIPGNLLIEWGLKGIEDEDAEYSCCVWKIGNHVIKAMLNYDQLGRKPISKTSFQVINDSFWGKGIPELIADCQQVCNACARSILSNIGIGALPQIGLNVDRLEPNASRKFLPGKIWPFTDEQMASNVPPITFYQPVMVTEKLMNVYASFSKIADEHSGVPAYSHGDSQVGGAGNSLADYESIFTPYGTAKISSIKAGDLISTTYGTFAEVTGVFPQGESDIFRMYFSNGVHVDCDGNHRWSVKTHHPRKFKTFTTNEIINKGLFRKAILGWRNPSGVRPKWMLPLVDRIEFAERSVNIDPYTMGALIGDGDVRCRLTCEDKEVFDNIPYPLGIIDRHDHGKAWTRCIKTIKKDYHTYGLNCKSLDKFIPKDYLYNSYKVRIELLRGMMDTDGCCTKAGETFYTTSSMRLANDFTELVRTLGGTTNGVTIRNKEGHRDFGRGNCFCQTGYCVTFNLPDEILFKIKRKADRVTNTAKRHVYITGIEYIGKHAATCISVNSDNKLFVCANGIPTHNTSSGLSMLMSSASRGIKNVIRNIDADIIAPRAEYHYDYLLDNFEIYGLLGDYQINAKGSSALQAQEQQVTRKLEFLNNTANPIDVQLVGPENRRKVLFDIAKFLGIELDENVLPPLQPQPSVGQVPPENPQTLDAAGNPAQGVDNNTENKKRPRQPAGGE